MDTSRPPGSTPDHQPSTAPGKGPYCDSQFQPMDVAGFLPSQLSQDLPSRPAADPGGDAPAVEVTQPAEISQTDSDKENDERELSYVNQFYIPSPRYDGGLMSPDSSESSECDHHDLGRRFGMIRLSDVQGCMHPQAHPLDTKLSAHGLTYVEKDIVSAVFNSDMVDWDSDSEVDLVKSHNCHTPSLSPRDMPSVIEEPRPIVWEDLNPGVRWIIIKILNGTNRFAKTVSMLLRLTSPQVHEFVAVYTTEYLQWQIYEQHVTKIPWQDLFMHAVETKTSVVNLIHENRPLLSTDQVSQLDIELGCAFLRARGLKDYISELRGWIKAGRLDFLSLTIEWDILQDCLDNKVINNAARRGWIDLDAVRNHVSSQAEVPPKRPGSPFLGTLKGRLPPREEQDKDASRPERVSIIDTGIDGVLNSAINQDWQRRELSILRPTPGPSGEIRRGPTPKESMELRHAIHRQFPQGFQHISGALATTLVEENRPMRPFRKATSFRTRQVPTEAPKSLDGDERELDQEIKVVVPVQAKPARPTYLKQPTPSEKRVLLQPTRPTKLTPVDEDQPDLATNEGGNGKRRSGALTAHLPPPTYASQDSLPDVEGSLFKLSERLDRRRLASTIVDAVSAGYNSIKSSVLAQPNPQHQDNGSAKSIQRPKPVAPDQLRNLLSNKFPGTPKRPPANVTGKGQQSKSQSIWGPDDDYEPCDFAPKVTESDSDYQPKETKKKTPRKSSGGQRKKGNNRDPSAKAGTSTCFTPSGSQRSNGRGQKKSPPSRIKIVSAPKSQQGSSENGQPSSTGKVPFTPTTPVKNEPLFGMFRNTPLASSLARADQAFYAWSADDATFAAISVKAHFAERADRIVQSPKKTTITSSDLAKQFEVFQQLKKEFAGVENHQKGRVAQDAKHAKFAGCADMALYAEQAEEALFSLNEVADKSIEGEVEGDSRATPKIEGSDMPMPDAPNDV
ncbi:hypothetical protein EDB80DRAFT_781160 [Ilyonectria destructans]|nr:hypothetical protein EDB80DRAFT_781160 [Ilyonectria destructans]